MPGRGATLIGLLALVGVAVPDGASAQTADEPSLVRGADVRVQLVPGPGGRRQGQLLAVERDYLVLRRDGFGWRIRPDTIARERVERLEVRRPTVDRGARTFVGGAVGAVLGAVVGGVVGAQATAGARGGDSPGIGKLYGVPLGGLVGLVLGAGVGRTAGRRWESVAWPTTLR